MKNTKRFAAMMLALAILSALVPILPAALAATGDINVTLAKGNTSNTLGNRKFVLCDANEVAIASASTDTNGKLTFSKLEYGTYKIVEDAGLENNNISPRSVTVTLSAATAKADFKMDLKPSGKVTVFFNKNHTNASGYKLPNPAYRDIGSGSTTTAPGTNPTRTGYTFASWYDTSAASGGTAFSQTKTFSKNATYYARWTPNKYTVIFNTNGGSGPMPNQSFTYGVSQTLNAGGSISSLTRTGYSRAGWNTKADGSGTNYTDKQSVSNLTATNNGTVTLYAKWTANKYTVTLNNQSGAGGTASVSAAYDAAMPAAAMPTRTGYAFGGYYDTSAATGGTQYYTAAGASARKWDKAGNTTLYARWAANKYTVTLDRQGGTGGTASVSAAYNAAMPPAAMPARTGYAFGGYYDATAGGTQYYTAAGASARAWNKASAATLYARWTPVSSTATLDMQGGAGGTASVSAAYDAAMPPAAMPARTGYIFEGYYDAASGGTQYYTAAGASARVWNKTSAATLYARWTAKTYTLTLDRQSGTGGTGSAVIAFGAQIPESIAPPSRENYVFSGYYTGTDGTGTQYYSSSGSRWVNGNWARDDDLTLYALWLENPYTVVFNMNYSGAAAQDPAIAAYNKTFSAPPAPTRTGHTFGGWFKDSICVVPWDFSKDTVMGNMTLYARWIPNTYVITATAGTGGSALGGGRFDHGMSVTLLAVPGAGYAFEGWYENGIKVSGAAAAYTLTAAASRTLQARFKQNPGGGGTPGGNTSPGGDANPSAPKLAGSVSVAGTAKLNKKLTADISQLSKTGNTALGIVSYQWLRNGKAIAGAVSSTYKVKKADAGQKISVAVKASNYAGSVTSRKRAVEKLKQAKFKIQGGSRAKNMANGNFLLKTKGGSGLGKVTWKSSNKKVAVVNKNGVVVIKGRGVAKITATKKGNKRYKAKKATVKVTVG